MLYVMRTIIIIFRARVAIGIGRARDVSIEIILDGRESLLRHYRRNHCYFFLFGSSPKKRNVVPCRRCFSSSSYPRTPPPCTRLRRTVYLYIVFLLSAYTYYTHTYNTIERPISAAAMATCIGG